MPEKKAHERCGGEGNGFAVFVKLDDGTVEGRAQAVRVPVPGEWVHVAATWDGTTLKIYVNGELEGTSIRSGVLTATTVQPQIGRGEQNDIFSNPLYGRVDELELFSSPLSETSIKAIYLAGAEGKCKS